MRLDELAREIGAELIGDGGIEVTAVSTLEDAREGQLSFLATQRYAKQLETTRASAVIVSAAMKPIGSGRAALLRARDPYLAFARAMERLHGHRKHPFAGVHAQAHVDSSAEVGDGTVVYPGAYIGPGARIGRNCVLYPNVTVYEGCVIGDGVILHAGAVVGADGYGFATHDGVHHKIAQAGNVIIEDNVEVGANTCIDRPAIGSTVIGRGTKIDDLVMIGHGVRIGAGSLVVAQVGIAGNVVIGPGATIAGQAGIAGNLSLGERVTVAAKSGVISDIPDRAAVMGMPAMPASHGRRVYTVFTQLPELLERVKHLEQQVENLTMIGGDEGVELV
ncbi:MAG TPA: UDP-3-O-(3-hydroxymyristoyl)glucosamine N-acyltransferase [Tepidisphaeraceae bacterium]|nr:UDP-3-O-(3-hydroxymyristoyl)glucosamine N-acyltransferase [Tepidisphaeraceae bacterium]